MPCGAEQTNTGTILVHEKTEIATSTKNVVIYARVSSYERKGCLEG
jgi:predicted site-specific integrase-resolvase